MTARIKRVLSFPPYKPIRPIFPSRFFQLPTLCLSVRSSRRTIVGATTRARRRKRRKERRIRRRRNKASLGRAERERGWRKTAINHDFLRCSSVGAYVRVPVRERMGSLNRFFGSIVQKYTEEDRGGRTTRRVVTRNVTQTTRGGEGTSTATGGRSKWGRRRRRRGERERERGNTMLKRRNCGDKQWTGARKRGGTVARG